MQYFDSARLFAVIEQDRKNVSPSVKALLKSDVSEVLSSYFDCLSGVKIQVASKKEGYEILVTATAKRIAPVKVLS